VAEYSRGAFRPQIGSLPAPMMTTATTAYPITPAPNTTEAGTM